MHIAPHKGERCFKETRVGLLNILMCDCITNAFYLMIILVSGDSLDIKELTYAIIINFTLYFDWLWAHLFKIPLLLLSVYWVLDIPVQC